MDFCYYLLGAVNMGVMVYLFSKGQPWWVALAASVVVCGVGTAGIRSIRIKIPLNVSFVFAWYDFWVGAYYDRVGRILYVCPLPMCVFGFQKK